MPFNFKDAEHWDESTHVTEGAIAALFDSAFYEEFEEEHDYPDEYAAIRCLTCDLLFRNIDDHTEECNGEDLEIFVKKEHQSLLTNPLKTSTRSWFHVTFTDDWYNTVIKAEATVHVGSLETVQDILKSYHLGMLPTTYVWEVSFDDASIAPWTCPDLHNTWETSAPKLKEAIGYDAVSYVNVFESPGSISYVVNPEKLNIVNFSRLENNDDINEFLETSCL